MTLGLLKNTSADKKRCFFGHFFFTFALCCLRFDTIFIYYVIPSNSRITFLPSVRTSLNHSRIYPRFSSLAFLSRASFLRDCLMLMLASGRNAIQTACSYLRAYKAPHVGLKLVPESCSHDSQQGS